MAEPTPWERSGAEGEPILGVTDVRERDARASVVLLHGHKGYSDYGFLPVLAGRLVEALPVVVHRYNASHSGMTRRIETFEKPELFARDTWNKQVFDLREVVRAARAGELPGAPAGGPVITIGHSRGGTACLLSAGREGEDVGKPEALVTLAATSYCCSAPEEARRAFDELGRLESPSGRTGQALWIDPVWLDEQDADPAGHDVLGLSARIDAPTLVVHGDADETVPVRCAGEIAAAVPGAELMIVPGGTHVFNTANPADVGGAMSRELALTVTAVADFVERVI